MPPAYAQCASYGPSWAILIVFASVLVILSLGMFWLFKWELEKQYSSSRSDQRDARSSTTTTNETMKDILHACERCHIDVVAKVRGETGGAVDKIITTARVTSDHIVDLLRDNNKAIIAAIGRIKENNEDLLRAVQRDNDLSRPYGVTPTPVFGVSLQVTPPPVLGVGSQVRDSSLPHTPSGRPNR